MRGILVDWLVEVHLKFKLSPGTLYLCIHILDLFCSKNSIERTKLQLVGVTSLLIACKYEEIYPPEVRECVYITDNAYTSEALLAMEQRILAFLEFKISFPTTYHFLARFLKIAGGGRNCSNRAHYFAERALQEHDVLHYKPSLIAASAVYLALRAETLDCWVSFVMYSV